MVRSVLLAVLLAVPWVMPHLAAAQGGLRVTHTVGRTTPTYVEVTGTVSNDTRADVIEVSVTIEALGASGKPVARGVSYVSNRLSAGSSASFTAKVPVVAGVTDYRATVASRLAQTTESP